MTKDNVISLRNREPFVDAPITEILRNGARKLLARALETEIEIFISQYKDLKDELGRQRIVRNGHLPERRIAETGQKVKTVDNGKLTRRNEVLVQRHVRFSDKYAYDAQPLPPR